jgi:GxxExxY protein
LEIPVRYKSVELNCGYRLDFVVERELIVEIKAVERLLAVHEAQVLTYLRLTGLRVALLVNFNVEALRRGLRRLTLTPKKPSRLPAFL